MSEHYKVFRALSDAVAIKIVELLISKPMQIGELEKQLDEVYMSKESINAYLYAKDDPSLPKDHPKRNFMNRYNGYLNSVNPFKTTVAAKRSALGL